MDDKNSTTQFKNLPPELQQLHEIYPDMNYDQLHEAWYNMERYLQVVMRVHDRISKTEHLEGAPRESTSSDINKTGTEVEKIVPVKMEESSGVV